MERVRQRWDALIRTYETGMAADVGGAPADVAARMHLALAGEYLERHRFRDAQRELGEAIRLDPKRPEALTVRGLIEAQLTGQPREALDDLRRAAALTPNHPVRAYLFARQLLATAGRAGRARPRRWSSSSRRRRRPDRRPTARRSSGSDWCRKCRASSRSFRRPRIAPGISCSSEGRYEDAMTRLQNRGRRSTR